jgi:tetratricopeptide (TPR) repeat protein
MAENTEKRDNGKRGRPKSVSGEKANVYHDNLFNTIRIILITASIVLILTALILAWFFMPASRSALIIFTAVFGFIGIYPLSYLAYRAFREKAQRKRLKDDFRLLGLVSEDELDETVNNLYLTVYSPTQFVVYILLIIVFSVIILTSFLSQQPVSFADRNTLTLVFFAFLGAYVFSIQELVRRFNTFDIQPQVYSSIFMRMVVAVVITFVGAAVINLSAGEIAGQGIESPTSISAWSAVLAFVIGVFPKRGLRWFTQRTNSILGGSPDASSERPLEKIIGISTWHEARLSEMGIDDAQNLAAADIRRLLLTTQFDTQAIIHWIDQSILYVKVGEKIDRYRDVKIATFSELRAVIKSLSLNPFKKLEESVVNTRTETRKRLASVLALTDPDELDRLTDYSNFPNYIHIAEFYSRTATVARQRANVAMDILIGALEETDYERAVEDGEQLLIQNPNDPALLLRLGTAYYRLGRIEEAKSFYSRAIELDPRLAEAYYSRSVIFTDEGDFDRAVRDATDALSIDPTNARALNNRGLAYIKMGYFDRALEDLNKALELDDRLSIAYFNRGVVGNALGEFEKANNDFRIAYLLGYRSADLWVSWGNAMLGMEQFEEAVDRLSQAVLYDSDLAAAYAKRGYAYLRLGPTYDFQARTDLEIAIKINADILTAYTNLGLLEARVKNYNEAIKNYQKALALNENHYPTRYNLALAYIKQGNQDQAKKEFERIINTAREDSFEAIQSSVYLSNIIRTVSQDNGKEIPVQPEPEEALE